MLGPGHVITTCLCDTGQVGCRSRCDSLFSMHVLSYRLKIVFPLSCRSILPASSVETGWNPKVSWLCDMFSGYAISLLLLSAVPEYGHESRFSTSSVICGLFFQPYQYSSPRISATSYLDFILSVQFNLATKFPFVVPTNPVISIFFYRPHRCYSRKIPSLSALM